jgi:hypothetical protein
MAGRDLPDYLFSYCFRKKINVVLYRIGNYPVEFFEKHSGTTDIFLKFGEFPDKSAYLRGRAKKPVPSSDLETIGVVAGRLMPIKEILPRPPVIRRADPSRKIILFKDLQAAGISGG